MTGTFTDPSEPAAGPTPDTRDLHARASARFGTLVHAARADQWDLPTPCAGWSVRDLVNHVVAENLWTAPLMEGATIAEVGDAYDGDVLGADPVSAWAAAAGSARRAVDAPGALDRTVHLSFGDTPATEYVDQLFADHLVHAWDLAQAIGADSRLDPDLVAACATWFAAVEDSYRRAGAIGPRPFVTVDADPQTRLLARFGRSDTLATVMRFNDAFNRHDVDTVMTLMTDDCVFDTTQPAPDGRRFTGQQEVRAEWERLFTAAPTARFDAEEIVTAGDRAVVRWTYDFGHGHVRGVDVLQVRDGRVAEKLSYVKG
jgi:uncharacterized protein (TIGR03086 family)